MDLSMIEKMVMSQALTFWKKCKANEMCQKDRDFVDVLIAKIKVDNRAENARLKVIKKGL